jgi:hypothetical protein
MTPPQVSRLYFDMHCGYEDNDPEQKDPEHAEQGYELEEMLGVNSGPLYEGDFYNGPFYTYPNVLNNHGTDSAIPRQNLPEDERIFRDLPNGGRRSPRSRLFCHLASQHSLPYVHALAGAEFCSNPALAEEQEHQNRRSIFDDDLPSDLEVADDVHDAPNDFEFKAICDASEAKAGNSSDGSSSDCEVPAGASRKIMKARRPSVTQAAVAQGLTNAEAKAGTSALQPSDRSGPDAKLLKPTSMSAREEYWRSVAADGHRFKSYTNDFDLVLQDVHGDDVDGAAEFREFVFQHMAGGGSINAAAVTARLSEFEDRYLASKAKEENAEDLRIALLRLKEATIEYAMLLPPP